ncbi:hypothetical protein ScPMuIL_017884 [Solemya velum]
MPKLSEETTFNQRSTQNMVSEEPKSCRYAVYDVRVSSFNGWWPVHKSQTPQHLATAGLFYTGSGDKVRCFSCGGGLRDWEDSDDPWVEHARWYPTCSFVQQVKGPDFVKAVQEASPEYPHSHSEAAIRKSECMRSSPAVLQILDMGFDRSLVEIAVDKIRDENRDVTTEDVLSLLLDREIDYSNSEIEMEGDHTENNQSTSEPTPTTNMAEKKSDPETEAEKEVPRAGIREMEEQLLCKICMDDQSCMVFLPCGHLVTCAMCAPALRTCPICRTNIEGTIRAYIP